MQQSSSVQVSTTIIASDALALAVAECLHSREGIAELLGIKLIEAREGFARITVTTKGSMTNGHRTVHGGIIFTLADTAFAYACNSRNFVTVAAQASIIFLSPAQEGEVLIAEAQEQACAGRSGAYVVQVATEDGRPVASFHGLARAIGGTIIPIRENDHG